MRFLTAFFLALVVKASAGPSHGSVLSVRVPDADTFEQTAVHLDDDQVKEIGKGMNVLVLDGRNPSHVRATQQFHFRANANASAEMFLQFLDSANAHDDGSDIFVFTLDHSTPLPASVREALSAEFSAELVDEVIEGDSYILVARRLTTSKPLAERFEPMGQGTGPSIKVRLEPSVHQQERVAQKVSAAQAATIHVTVPDVTDVARTIVTVNDEDMSPKEKGMSVLILDGASPSRKIDSQHFHFRTNANKTAESFISFVASRNAHEETSDVYVFTLDHSTPLPSVVRDTLVVDFKAELADEVIEGDSYVLVSRRNAQQPLSERFQPMGDGVATATVRVHPVSESSRDQRLEASLPQSLKHLQVMVPDAGDSEDRTTVTLDGIDVSPGKGMNVVILGSAGHGPVVESKSFHFSHKANHTVQAFMDFVSTGSAHDDGNDVFVFTVDHSTPLPGQVRDVLAIEFGAELSEEVLEGDSYVLVSAKNRKVPLMEKFTALGDGGVQTSVHIEAPIHAPAYSNKKLNLRG